MPCLIITGHPSAGKTTLAYLLKERALLHDDIDEVVVVNEESECGCCLNDDDGNDNKNETPNTEKNKVVTTKQELYETSFAEKQTRAALKSGFDRAVKKNSSKNNSRRLVILDSLNYIKGFRYELHCISKAAGEKHGILWVLNRSSVVQQWNKCSTSNSHSPEKKNNQQRYSTELLQELISRYEPPDSRNRWDQPLFTVDVATSARLGDLPASNKDEEVVPLKNEISTRNEVLEQSVYNMHSLGDAFGASATVPTNDSNLQPTTTESSFAPATSHTIKPPKKSAFQRKKKITPSDKNKKKIVTREDDECNSGDIPTSIGTCPVSNSIIGSEKATVDHIPTSNKIMMRSDADESSNCGTLTPKQPSSQIQQQPSSSNKPLEEQLDEILDLFLLKTSNLKEGMSTRQYV
jgi:tRNA uridine 5-carbamoylmethylation protein Kti12